MNKIRLMNKYQKITFGILLPLLTAIGLVFSCAKASVPSKPPTAQSPIFLADPTIFYYQGTYYLYGTNDINADEGIPVYTSTDSKTWKGPAGNGGGLALKKGDSYGTAGFWAPQVFQYQGTFYMAYVADTHIAIATSSSPLGPFTQQVIRPVTAPVNIIDPYVFIDSDGRKYLYHVRLQGGNRIYVAELKDDFSDVLNDSAWSCINAVVNPQPWENTTHASSTVTEGPTVLRHNGSYYLFYSANVFQNPDYAVGYAVASSPTGPWTKYAGNPILDKSMVGENGTGHGDFFTDADGQYRYVFHTHNSAAVVTPRKTALISGGFAPGDAGGADKMVFDKDSFFYFNTQ
jgi:xylan 1,4-beta-xylosidase